MDDGKLSFGQILERKVESYCTQMSVAIPRIRVKRFRSRWGSCSSKGRISFNLKLVLAPPAVIDYVVVHELAHLREMNHSARFWAIVGKNFPGYKEQKKWLRHNGHLLRLD